MKRLFLLLLAALAAVALGLFHGSIADRLSRESAIEEQRTIVVPKPERKPSSQESKTLATHPELKEEVNWDVPFTSQAPLQNWDALHEDACEEASVLMALRYFAGKPFSSPEDADKNIVRLVDVNERILGYAKDQTAQQVAALLAKENKRLRISVVASPTEVTLKDSLSQGHIVIMPAAGRELRNPYFKQPGPVYHMLVIRGYTKDGYVITNDPGTKRGEQFVYPWGRLLDAVHDWNDGDVIHGDKVAIIVGQYVPPFKEK